MKKTFDIICLVLWTIQLVIAIAAVCGLVTVNPICYICAVVICIMHYVYELVG